MTKDELIAEWIDEWVSANYGPSETEEPSWNIWELAQYLNEKFRKNNNLDIVTWCQNWLITSNRATNAKDFEVLGRAIVGCSMIVEHPDGSITNGYSYLNRKNSNATWRAGELIDGAIREWKIMNGEEK